MYWQYAVYSPVQRNYEKEAGFSLDAFIYKFNKTKDRNSILLKIFYYYFKLISILIQNKITSNLPFILLQVL